MSSPLRRSRRQAGQDSGVEWSKVSRGDPIVSPAPKGLCTPPPCLLRRTSSPIPQPQLRTGETVEQAEITSRLRWLHYEPWAFCVLSLGLMPHNWVPILTWHAVFWVSAIRVASSPAGACLCVAASTLAGLWLTSCCAQVPLRCMYGMASLHALLRMGTVAHSVFSGGHEFRERSQQFRVSYCFWFHDLRLLSVAPPSLAPELAPELAWRLLVAGLLTGLADTLLVLLLSAETAVSWWLYFPGRWLLGAGKFYNGMMVLDLVYRLPLALAGLDQPSTHVEPLLSVSLADFWGHRWNSTIRGFLRGVYLPFRTRGYRVAGLLATFLASGLWHVFPMLLAQVPLLVVLAMMAFFAVQPLALLVESGLLALPPARGELQPGSVLERCWVFIVLGMCCPLFVEPYLQAFGQ